MKNALICAARSMWYATMEPTLLHLRRGAWRKWEWDKGDPLVSVYVPTHNRCELLMTRALPSILGQTYRNIEVVVAAHGCTDGTASSVRRGIPAYSTWNGRLREVRVLNVPRTETYPPTAENHWLAGPVVPCNAALKACRGQWIMRIDDDDILEPDAIEKLLRFAQANDYEYVSAAHETDKGKVEPYMMNGVRVGGIQTTLYRHYLSHFKYNIACWAKKTDRVNDVDLQCRMVNAGVRMGYLDEVVAKVLPRPGQTEVGSKAYLADAAATERKYSFSETAKFGQPAQ